MEEHINYHGVLRIRNPKTLQRWIDSGKFQAELEGGWIFAVGCGRFRSILCTCSKCRKSTNSPLKLLLDKYNLPHNQSKTNK